MNIKLLAEFINKAIRVKRLIEQSSSIENKAISMLQFQALEQVKSSPKITVGALAKSLSMSLSSTTQLINRLVNANLMIREVNPDDRRVIFLSIAKAGEREISLLKKQSVTKQFKVLTSIPDNDLKEMIRIFTKIINENS